MIEVEQIAPLSGVQDGGRHSWRALGVPSSGPLDDWSMAISNLLVGNPIESAVLELGFGHTTLRFHQATVVALCGARAMATIDAVAAPLWRPIWIGAGSVLKLSPGRLGARCYLAIAGALSTPTILGSQSAVSSGSQFPSLLKRGARLPLVRMVSHPWPTLTRHLPGTRAHASPWWLDGEPLLDLEAQASLRVIEGAHAQLLGERRALFTQPFRLSMSSNRMAARLDGARLAIRDAGSLISEPVLPGTIQLPPDGQPVILLAEAQTIGGYPRIGHLASVDMARLAQRRVGAELRFEPIGVEHAQRLWLWRRERLNRMRIAVDAKLAHRD